MTMPEAGKPKLRRGQLDLRVPFFRPMWRRTLTVVALSGWTIVEVLFGNPFWAALTGGIGVYAAYVFFFDFDRGGELQPVRGKE